MASIKYENPDFPLGEEIYVKDLGTLINGESVEFSDEQIARYEAIRGEGAFYKISYTDQYDDSLMNPTEESVPVEDAEVEVEEEAPALEYPDAATTEAAQPIQPTTLHVPPFPETPEGDGS